MRSLPRQPRPQRNPHAKPPPRKSSPVFHFLLSPLLPRTTTPTSAILPTTILHVFHRSPCPHRSRRFAQRTPVIGQLPEEDLGLFEGTWGGGSSGGGRAGREGGEERVVAGVGEEVGGAHCGCGGGGGVGVGVDGSKGRRSGESSQVESS
ncbi:hypothetical protein BDV95DRAFT_594952 [Massariosphaeria phaeospora]|uniref:Uncharacterized protein n=1 Tax=Massariosphaeria phaeospora TaxID=100035 RepID=A0A7C8ME32_9PLEO|nr:hypothetical protein BDV95DRAFT_594952 [Massariosphaeria phaeospora]